ncbi:hypothetical protein [Actinomadura rugatobispora]|uniref:Peptidase C58 YopT-type domain-containing protein n=1 Tax=Actinomadura rugatobispora TaxID=1994 RepID=A0ABW0ZTJ5_9ACTN|nr:hypothetical protein GCM10010200_058270 [Actinomadura rugatobispora]
MPKRITTYLMTEADYRELETVIHGTENAGICVAIALDWLTLVYTTDTAPAAFAGQNLRQLAAQQLEYRRIAEERNGDAGLIEYAASRGFTVERKQTRKIADDGEFDPFDALDDNTGYLLCFTESSIGRRLGHTAALFKEGEKIYIRDQNIGQMEVDGEGRLHEKYQDVMMAQWKEVNKQRALAKKDENAKVTSPEYRYLTVYSARRG